MNKYRFCLKDFEVTDPQGRKILLEKGDRYLTSIEPYKENTVSVFIDYVYQVPKDVFVEG